MKSAWPRCAGSSRRNICSNDFKELGRSVRDGGSDLERDLGDDRESRFVSLGADHGVPPVGVNENDRTTHCDLSPGGDRGRLGGGEDEDSCPWNVLLESELEKF